MLRGYHGLVSAEDCQSDEKEGQSNRKDCFQNLNEQIKQKDFTATHCDSFEIEFGHS